MKLTCFKEIFFFLNCFVVCVCVWNSYTNLDQALNYIYNLRNFFVKINKYFKRCNMHNLKEGVFFFNKSLQSIFEIIDYGSRIPVTFLVIKSVSYKIFFCVLIYIIIYLFLHLIFSINCIINNNSITNIIKLLKLKLKLRVWKIKSQIILRD